MNSIREVFDYPMEKGYLAATIVFFAVLSVTWLIGKLLVSRLSKRAASTESLVDDLMLDLIRSTRFYFYFSLAVYAALFSLEISARVRTLIDKSIIMVFLLQFAQWATLGVNFWIQRYLKKKADQDAASATTLGLISFSVKAVLYVVILLLVLTNLGVDITALVAGLGVGGIAVALALQNVLGDLFASLTIVLDKPFIVGDFIVVGEFSGNVEHIGLKTTRVRSLSGEQLIFSNSDLLGSRVRNFKRMRERRVVQNLTVTYQSTEEQLKGIPSLVREIVESKPKARFDRCHFLRFQDSSLEFELVYWVSSPEFQEYADIAQAINLDIFSRFGALKIDFAYPTRTLYMKSDSA